MIFTKRNSIMLNLADGQLPTTAGTLFTGSEADAPRIGGIFSNTSASLTETITLSMKRNNGNTRRIRHIVLGPNEQLVMAGLPCPTGDLLLGITTDATTVDYLIQRSEAPDLNFTVHDANGSIKQVSTITGLLAVTNEVQGTLTTVGAGQLLSAVIADGMVLRTGSTSAFTDTTDTGTQLASAIANIAIGHSFELTYQNSTYAVATLTGGTGVNAAATFGIVGPGCWATFLFTYTAANTFTVVQKAGGDNWIGLPSTSYSTGTTTTTFTAAEMTGGKLTIYTSTAATPGSIATATATAMFAAIQGAYVGLKWIFRVINDVATNSLTITADASVTLSGKTTYVATPYGSMDFEMTFTSPTAATMKYIGGGQSTTV
jgi:hypothetical protein